MNEVFLPVPDFPNYEISNIGRLRNNEGKMVSPLKTSCKRYYRYSLRKNGAGCFRNVSSLVAEVHVPNPHNYKHFTYKDNNPNNYNANNIVWIDNEVYRYIKLKCLTPGRKKQHLTRDEQIKRLMKNIESAKLFLSYLLSDDNESINSIVLLYEKEVRDFISKLTRKKEIQDDCFQQTAYLFLDACQRNVITTSDLKGYLCGIARNYMRKHWSKKKTVEYKEYLNEPQF